MGIIISNLSHRYNMSRKNSLTSINLELENENIYGLIGKNGSGKTTLLELIDGLLKPLTGEILIDDISVENNKNEIKKKIGFLFQFPENQFFENTVKKEIEFALNNFNMKKDKINQVLNLVGLSESYLNKNINKLSGGEKRLIALASILVYNPPILLLDEPTIGLDLNNRNKLIHLIKTLKNEYNKTIIIVSHDSDLLYEICDELIILDKGILIMHGDPISVYKEEELIEKYNINLPNIIKLEYLLKKNKNIKLMNTKTINDLIKEVYRNV